jgi:hypothetical protein
VRVRQLFVSSLAVALVLGSASASAQLRGDIGAYGGVSQRVLSPATGGGALPGPQFGLEGHVALFPLLRIGAYVHGELAPTNNQVASKELLAVGARIKVVPPWPRGDWRMWVALGVGYVGAYSPAYTQSLTLQPINGGTPTTTKLSVDGAGGGFLELPISVGVAYRRLKPFMIFAELTGRIGLAFSGSLYGGTGGRGAKDDAGAPSAIASDGKDVFGAGLALGIGFDL